MFCTQFDKAQLQSVTISDVQQSMSHYGRAGSERMTLVVDVDHTLTNLLECAAAWHESEHGSKINVKNLLFGNLATIWGEDDAASKLHQFYESKQFETDLVAVAGASDVLKPLRKYFSLLAITDRPRFVEKQTREWLDHHYPGVFDKLVFVDEDHSEHFVARKKEVYDELKAKIVVGSDADMLVKAAVDVEHVVMIGSVPKAEKAKKFSASVTQVADWFAAQNVLDQVIKDLKIQPSEKVFAGPRLSRYTDDLVTVSTRKPAVFYANIINSKFTVQKQESVRLQASEAAITTAVQAAEILRNQNNATTTKIMTRYALNRAKERGGYRVPKIELVLQRVAREA
ncbi:hypothetical protein L915_04925 [Plasmopara halstedii]|uniref:DNA/RNA-binding protein Alba-like domain-containing protein n=1 Tax=Plasmopara halstedii TaxID=4781 RepID=A0A0P1AIA2_PLAHL|nr:hypothetical protein L915_04925 [Plasmopara halstedii]CEG40917.1 hypothetical protein L915_04925 [Plasmopara halstedii]|eukprot:XP_024577286.1 hypothetical protein L915_04925 [Plasmopara halstedii]